MQNGKLPISYILGFVRSSLRARHFVGKNCAEITFWKSSSGGKRGKIVYLFFNSLNYSGHFLAFNGKSVVCYNGNVFGVYGVPRRLQSEICGAIYFIIISEMFSLVGGRSSGLRKFFLTLFFDLRSKFCVFRWKEVQ